MERQRAGPETMARLKNACVEAVETIHWLMGEAVSFIDENETLERRVRELEAERGKLVARIVELEHGQIGRPAAPKGARAKVTKPK
jgi:hypothetical protein